MRRFPRLRRCTGPRKASLCATALDSRRSAKALLDARIRHACASREDFTTRGFGRERRREAR